MSNHRYEVTLTGPMGGTIARFTQATIDDAITLGAAISTADIVTEVWIHDLEFGSGELLYDEHGLRSERVATILANNE